MIKNNYSYTVTGHIGQKTNIYNILKGHSPEVNNAQGIYRFIKDSITLNTKNHLKSYLSNIVKQSKAIHAILENYQVPHCNSDIKFHELFQKHDNDLRKDSYQYFVLSGFRSFYRSCKLHPESPAWHYTDQELCHTFFDNEDCEPLAGKFCYTIDDAYFCYPAYRDEFLLQNVCIPYNKGILC